MNEMFWAALALISYTYFGYLLWLKLLSKLRPQPIRHDRTTPSVSVVIAAHNEERNLPAKLSDLRSIRYPAPLQIVVVSDGSTDGTNSLVQGAAATVTAVILPKARGKAFALNAGVQAATGEILVFFDARQVVEANALLHLTSYFADEDVGAVSGELELESYAGNPQAGLYWKIEKTVRRLESASGSVVGVTGAIFAMRRSLYVPLPLGTILDDVLTPMQVVRAGKRVVFCSAAKAHDRVFAERGKEFSRKVRTLTGNFQLLQLAPWLLSFSNPILFRFVSHKLLRLLVPWLLAVLLISAGCATGAVYKAALIAQLLFYGLALAGRLAPSTRRFRLVSTAETFTMLNLAAAIAFYNFATRRKDVWV